MSFPNRLPSFLATMVWEGSAHLSLIRSDPGNWTGNRVGIGQLKGTKWGVAAGSHPTLDIAALTSEQALEIFVRGYWAPLNGDSLAIGLDHCVSDDGYNAGPAAARRRLGKIAHRSAGVSVAADIHAYTRLRLSFLEALRTWKIFGRGWAARCAGVEAEAIRMAARAERSRALSLAAAVKVGISAGMAAWILFAAGGDVALELLGVGLEVSHVELHGIVPDLQSFANQAVQLQQRLAK